MYLLAVLKWILDIFNREDIVMDMAFYISLFKRGLWKVSWGCLLENGYVFYRYRTINRSIKSFTATDRPSFSNLIRKCGMATEITLKSVFCGIGSR